MELTPQITIEPGLLARMQAAVADADRRGHSVVTTEHLVLELVREPATQAILSGCGVDLAELERELDEYLELLTDGLGRPKADASYWRLIQRAALHASGAARKEVLVSDLLASLSREPETYAAMLLRAAGVERVDLLRQISHQRTDVRPVAPAGAQTLAIRFHNDDYTSMELVVQALEQVLGLAPDPAKKLMMEVHTQGSAIVARLPSDEALDRALEIYALAADAEAPLRVTLLP